MLDTGSKNDNLASMIARAVRMMFGTLASRILGLIREMFTAALFGATRQLDAFYIAYTLANLTRQLLAEGALSASFIPVFSRSLYANGKASASALARQAFTVLFVGCLFVVLAGVVCAPLLVRIMAPGFVPAERTLAISLTRMMFPLLLIVSLAALFMGILNSMGSFFIPAVAPAFSNLAYIFALLISMRKLSIWNLAAAVLFGGAASLALQGLWCIRMGMVVYPAVPKKDDRELREMMRLFLPYAAGLSLNQINPVISRMFGSFLEGGTISVLNYADRVLQLPLGLFVIALSQAVLPMLSRQDVNDKTGFRDFIRDALRLDLFVILPVAVGFFFASYEIINLLFFRGSFSVWALNATSSALSVYSLGLPGMACSTLVLRAIYARKMPKAAVSVTGITVAVNLLFCPLLMLRFQYAGLAAAAALAFTCAAVYGTQALSRDLSEKLGIFDRGWAAKISFSLLTMIFYIFMLKYVYPYPEKSAIITKSLWVMLEAVGSAAVYLAMTKLLRCGEWDWIVAALKNKKRAFD